MHKGVTLNIWYADLLNRSHYTRFRNSIILQLKEWKRTRRNNPPL